MNFMKKLGRIFRKYWKWIIGLVLVILVLIFVKPFELLGISFRNTSKIARSVHWTMARAGTDENRLFNLLEPLSGADLVKVYRSFGVQPYGLSGGMGWFGSDLNLFEWFEKELNRNERERMRLIWHKSGLEITF